MMNTNVFHEILGSSARESQRRLLFLLPLTPKVKNAGVYSPLQISKLFLNKIDPTFLSGSSVCTNILGLSVLSEIVYRK